MRRRCCCRKCAPGLGPIASFSYGMEVSVPCTVSLQGTSTVSPGRTIGHGEWYRNDEETPFATGYPVQGGVLINEGDDIRLKFFDNFGCWDEVVQAPACFGTLCAFSVGGAVPPMPLAITLRITGAIGRCGDTGTPASELNRDWVCSFRPRAYFSFPYTCVWMSEMFAFDCAWFNSSLYNVAGQPAPPPFEGDPSPGFVRWHIYFTSGINMTIRLMRYRPWAQSPGSPFAIRFEEPYVFGVTTLGDFVGKVSEPVNGNGFNQQVYGSQARVEVLSMSY